MSPKHILVTGATGNQGGALITAVLNGSPEDFTIYALTRNIASSSALNLASRSERIHLIAGNTTDPAPIFAQLPSLDAVFLVTTPDTTEREQAIPFIDAAIAAGVQYFIYTSADRGGSVRSETDPTSIPHFGVKMEIEQYLKAACEMSTMTWTILRPTSFMDNLKPGFVGKIAAAGLKSMGEVRISLICTGDIGRVAAKCLEDPKRHSGRSITLTGETMRYRDIEAIFREQVGVDMQASYGIIERVLEWVIGDLGASMRWFREGGYDYEIDEDTRREFGLRDFRMWLKEESKYRL